MKKIGIKTIIKQETPWTLKPLLSKDKLEKLEKASSVALGILAVTGTVALSIIAPNLIGTIGKLSSKKRLRNKKQSPPADKQTTETLYYLKRSGLIKIKPHKKDFVISLTNLGKRKSESLNLECLTIPKPKNWNSKWWLAAADIPTKDHRQAADLLRKKLKDLNFYPLQKTLWLYPYNPARELDFILHQYHIQNFVTLMEISRLDKEDESKVKKFFKANKIL